MKHYVKLFLVSLLSVLTALISAGTHAQGVEFRSVNVAAATLWDGPSDKAKKLFVAPRGMPVEVVSQINTWVKVRDMAGDISWVSSNELSKLRTVVATTLATVRATGQENAPPVFQAERGVTLEVLDSGKVSAGYARVKHRDGTVGFVKATEVWGL